MVTEHNDYSRRVALTAPFAFRAEFRRAVRAELSVAVSLLTPPTSDAIDVSRPARTRAGDIPICVCTQAPSTAAANASAS